MCDGSFRSTYGRSALAMRLRSSSSQGIWVAGALAAACVPSGNADRPDAGASPAAEQHPQTAVRPPPEGPAADVLRAPFEDTFDRAPKPAPALVPMAPPPPAELGPDWVSTAPGVWRIEGGRLCGERAHNHGVWMRHAIPVNARIEFDAVSDAVDGDLKAEYWGDGRSYATSLSYTNATSYLTIFGGWHNKFHVLARIDEHGNDRKQINVDPTSDDPREKPVFAGQVYHFKVERSDGKTVRWWVDQNEMLSYADPAPLVGPGHDHFGFNDWEVKVCFDNVRIAPLP
jgi:hypothetical protein